MRSAWILLIVAASTSSFAEDERLEKMSSEHRAWLEEEVVYINSDRERDVFLTLDTLEERNRFIEAFWKKRDPNPATLVNEFKEEHSRRVDHANEFLGRETSLPGWKTDEGRMYIILGEPVEIQRFDGYRELVSIHMWFYQSDPKSGLPPFFYLVFFKKFNAGRYQLYNPVTDGPRALLVTGLSSGISNIRALDTLRQSSPELARVSLSFDPSDPGDLTTGRASLGTDLLISRIYESLSRAVGTGYADAWMRYGKKVASDYSFNFVPSRSVFSVLAGPNDTPFVHYSIELDPENFTLETDEKNTRYYTTVDINVEVTDEEGRSVEAMDQEIYFQLSPSEAQQVGASPFAFQEAFPLVPGDYTVTVILRNRAVKQYTAAEHDVHVPAIPQEAPWLSDVVLGYRSELDVSELGEEGFRVFQLGPRLIHPAADGTFFLGETVEASFQVLGADPDHRLSFALYQGEQKLQERSTSVTDYRDGLVHESFSLTDMIGGRYVLRVRLVDPSGNSVAERAPNFQVSPRSDVRRTGFVSRRSFDVGSPGSLALRRGKQLRSLRRIEEAREEFEKAVAADNPDLPEARWQLAWLLIQTGRAEIARDLLVPLEADFPDQFEVVAGLGVVAYFARDFSTAVGYLERAMTIRPPDTFLLNILGDSLARLGRSEEAVEAFERSLALNPQQENIRERLETITRSH